MNHSFIHHVQYNWCIKESIFLQETKTSKTLIDYQLKLDTNKPLTNLGRRLYSFILYSKLKGSHSLQFLPY